MGHKLYSKVLRPSLYYAPPTYMRPASYSMVIKSYTYARLWSNNFTHLSPLDLFNFPSPFILWCRGFAQFLKCSLSNQAHLLPYILKAKRSADFARRQKYSMEKSALILMQQILFLIYSTFPTIPPTLFSSVEVSPNFSNAVSQTRSTCFRMISKVDAI